MAATTAVWVPSKLNYASQALGSPLISHLAQLATIFAKVGEAQSTLLISRSGRGVCAVPQYASRHSEAVGDSTVFCVDSVKVSSICGEASQIALLAPLLHSHVHGNAVIDRSRADDLWLYTEQRRLLRGLC